MNGRMFAALHMNRLQRKVLLVIAVIIVVPMLVTGILSASWISSRIDVSIEQWVREAAQVNMGYLDRIHTNAALFADVLEESGINETRLSSGTSPISPRLQLLAGQMGINLVQVYDTENRQLYSNSRVRLATYWAQGQDTAIVRAQQDGNNLLAAITIVRIPRDQPRHYRLVLGTLLDKDLLTQLNRITGLKTRLFYPSKGDFAKAFSEEDTSLKLQLPLAGFNQLLNKQEYYSQHAENDRYWGLYSPVIDATGRVEAVLFSGLEHRGSNRLLTDQGVLTLVVVALGILLAVVTGLFLGRFVIRPVQDLRDGVMKVAAQDFRASIPIYTKDELGDLARAFNDMAASLREARDEQRHEFQRDKIAALGELSLAMAHEIRNPIGVINTASRLLESADSSERRAELHGMIREESLRLDQLLKDFQQLARHRQPEFSEINAAEPLEAALDVMLAGHDQIRLVHHRCEQVCRISADKELLRQAWVNLIRNALDAMGTGNGELTVTTRLDKKRRQVVVTLCDSGPGIPLETMTRLFEPFYTTKNHGSGLGLTIANTLVEANGASLELVPQEGRGACFAMRFNTLDEDQ
jgi:signal transduction histidine kinase